MAVTINKAIKDLDTLKSLNENKFDGFYCYRHSREGVLLITNLRLSFVFTSEVDNDEELLYDHYIYSMLKEARFLIADYRAKIEINYAYEKIVFISENRDETLKIKHLIETYAPSVKTSLDYIDNEQLEKSLSMVDTNNKARHTDLLVSSSARQGTDMLNPSLTQPLSLPEGLITTPPVSVIKRHLYKAIALGIVLASFIAILPYFTQIKEKSLGYANFSVNLLNVQRCDSEMLVLGSGITDEIQFTKAYPSDMVSFIQNSFKGPAGKDPSIDPWGLSYQVTKTEDGFSIMSYGPDKKKGTFDDMVRDFTVIIKD